MNKKLFLLPFLAISLLVGCGPTGDPSSSTGPESSEGPGSSETPGSSEGEKEIWEEDLVEGESTIAQVKAGTVGDYYKVRGTVIANSGSTFGLARGSDFIYCYNFKEGGNDNLAAHPLGSYVEVYAKTSVYSESIQLTAYDGGYDENAKLTVLANDGEPVQPVECTTADSLSNANAAGKLVKVSFVPDENMTFTSDASSDQDLDGTVNGTKVTLRMEKYCPADVRAALIQENGATFEMGATYEVIGLGAARSDGTVRVFLCEGSTWTKTAEASFADPTEVIVDTEDGSAATVEAGKTLELVFMVEPATAKQLVVWSSADETIATVDEDGIVTGVKAGTVKIKAAAADDETVFAEIEVTVTAPAAKPLTKAISFDFTGRTEKGTYLDSIEGETIVEFFQNTSDGGEAIVDAKSYNVTSGNYQGGAHGDASSGFLKFGTGSKAGELSITFSGLFNKVVLTAHDWYKKSADHPTNTNTIAVNGGEPQLAPYTEDLTAGTLTFDLATASDTLSIVTGNRVFIYTMVVSYGEGGSTGGDTPVQGETLVLDPSSLTGKGTALPEDATDAVKAIASDASVITSVSAIQVYDGNGTGGAYESTPGLLKFGSSKVNGELTLTLTREVSKVVVSCHDWYTQSTDYPTTASKTAVNDVELGNPYNADGTPEDLVFEIAASNEITIKTVGSKARIFVFEITLYYAA